MADTYYGVNLGHGVEPGSIAGGSGVTVGSSTSGAKIELRVENGAGISKHALLNALQTLRNTIIERGAPA